MILAKAKDYLVIELKSRIARYDKQLGIVKGEELAATLADFIVSNFPEIEKMVKNDQMTEAKESGIILSQPNCIFSFCPYTKGEWLCRDEAGGCLSPVSK